MAPVCSIVIRAYNEEKHLGRLLTGITHQSIKNVQVILVDSGSSDGTLDVAAGFPVDVISISPEDFTFGRSLNYGISAAQSEIVVIASGHVYPIYPDWLEKLIAPFEDPQVAITYGKQRGDENSQFSEQKIFKQWFPDRSQPRQDHPFCNNANAAIRLNLWKQHPYNESLTGLEDLAWARWAFEQGYAISYVADAVVAHVHSETWQGVYNRYRREGMAFKQIYPQEHFHFLEMILLFSRNYRADIKSARHLGLPGSIWHDIFMFRLMQFWGTYQGYRQSGPLTARLKQTFYYPSTAIPAAHHQSTRQIDPIRY